MLQYGIYSVISPEGCASILWKDAAKASEAAKAMGITADKIFEHKLVDQVIKEPLGGAHRNIEEMAARLKQVFVDELHTLNELPMDELLNQRYKKFMSNGGCIISPILNSNWLSQLKQYTRLYIGYSGGLDSTVLLHRLITIPELGSKLIAVHINHGLSDHAQTWQHHCELMCQTFTIPLMVQEIRLNQDANNVERESKTSKVCCFLSSN